MKVKFFYRDGNNYKCMWTQEVDNDCWNDFVQQIESDGDSIEDFLDKDLRSECLFEMSDFGLNVNDIPLISKYGESDADHSYVSIIEYGGLV